MLKSKLLLTGLLALSLVGCATRSKPHVIVQHSLPDARLLADCPVPALDPSTNGELADGALALLDSLAGCNDDKAALREWAKTLKGASNARTP